MPTHEQRYPWERDRREITHRKLGMRWRRAVSRRELPHAYTPRRDAFRAGMLVGAVSVVLALALAVTVVMAAGGH
jgi:hypothetical protein